MIITPNFQNHNGAYMSQNNHGYNHGFNPGSEVSLVKEKNKMAKKIFSPFSRLPFLPKE